MPPSSSARSESSTFLPGPTGFSLLAMQMTPRSTACRFGFEGGPHAVLAAAAPDAAGESRARADAGGLDETYVV